MRSIHRATAHPGGSSSMASTTTSILVRTVLLALALSPLGCGPSHGAPAAPAHAAATAPKAALFEPVPASQLPNHYNPHDREGKIVCQACHGVEGGLLAAADETCRRCHKSRDGHPVGVVQAAAPAGLPLLAGGILTCHTCHDPHSGMKSDGLRLDHDVLCLRCHKQH